eukprot:gnl/TRDRNA2_/TRDRNA2_49020_c0_seq1.p1 gnl/TRDRNA2_/TRDRNA2_49020_c0~~gnl/TRDRNA2_/TRDRNA2_49020_c0_seq1.p1  ORF type:complete len:216 (+),score=39.07 gnl/TRDRNA2_/TRDRNA2_49020_c0_seq1:77-724(+)
MTAIFNRCCCTEAEDNTQIIYDTTSEENPAFVEAAAAGSAGSPPAATGNVSSREQTLSARSLTPEEKAVEKSRLQSLVNAFAKKAVKGVPCVYIREGAGKKYPTTYKVDKALVNLTVISPEDPLRSEVICPIAAIQDIFSVVEDGEGCFPQEVLSICSQDDKPLLLMVVYSSAGKLYRFCLLEESQAERDTFLECVRILCIYAQSAMASGEPNAV